MNQTKPSQRPNTMMDIQTSSTRSSNQTPKKKLGSRNLNFKVLRQQPKFKILAAVIAFAVAGFFIYNYVQTRNELNRSSDPQAAASIEAQKLAKEVGKFLELPKDEAPTVATVRNVSQLQDQPFFSNAQNGDKVLIYPQTGKAVLYRPSTKKVIEYAQVSLSSTEQSP